ncbi:sodium-dependent transporter [Catenisphaera adipataccumulans]|jgi:NSS family neurotransmitter:Na+ symporter|uniref:Transporter n=1 Tax=Catenisphaera adipataccumulans TaxID=700500 RepID=A0A7W8CWP5_9FIRM|nr:sodium-dependent transporter [Catenisphaera adipataccumulans]MBB5182976.1 NSS family neurotransmitter:Na+ symporter [Catenisphaera adipataccumulans]
MEKKRNTFSGRLAFVLAAAGSAVGLGNIWRFPYLAAEYGGGVFLFIYLILVATFGYTMIMSESALGRMTQKSPVGAFGHFGSSFAYKFGGWINAVVPMLIVPYYSVIGGWVSKYLFEYICGHVDQLATDTYFSSFLADGTSVELWFVFFALLTIGIIYMGVQNGIERVSSIMVPILVVLAVIVTIYSVTRPGAFAGVKYFLIPNMKHFTWMTVVSAMGQMFYSLSIAMGILYTFGSYMKKEVDMEKATTQVEWFDTAIALLAGLMIIPAVFAFSGGTQAKLSAGPSLMFITIPKVFASMGMGQFGGIMFFLLVFFAALTSSIALLESAVSTLEDEMGWSRKKSDTIAGIIVIALGTLSSLGFNVLSNVTPLGMDFLSFFDFITNSIMMPIGAIATCLLILRKVTIQKIYDEVLPTSKFKRRKVYVFVLKYLAIPFLIIILLSSVANVLGIIHM